MSTRKRFGQAGGDDLTGLLGAEDVSEGVSNLFRILDGAVEARRLIEMDRFYRAKKIAQEGRLEVPVFHEEVISNSEGEWGGWPRGLR